MGDLQFFPTPDDVIDRMVAPYLFKSEREGYWAQQTFLSRRSVLDPSAGDGRILDRLIEKYDRNKRQVSAIEIDDNRIHVLQGKGYPVLDTDFLRYDPTGKDFDLIIMNPPFAAGARHLLKAWDILREGDIVCLLNANTINDPYTKERQLLLRVIAEHGSIEEIGRPFDKSEITASVDVVMVRLSKSAEPEATDFGAGFDQSEAAEFADYQSDSPAMANAIDALVSRYDAARRMLVEQEEINRRYDFFVKGVSETSITGGTTYEQRLDALKSGFWKYLFDKTKLGKNTTSKFRENFSTFRDQNLNMAFSKKNILRILDMFFLNRASFMSTCVVDVFDSATRYHEKNRVYLEGWKTNKSWRINKRVIMPNVVKYDTTFSLSYYGSGRSFLADVDIVLCWLSGRAIEEINTARDALDRQMKGYRETGEYRAPFHSTFFKMRMFKKGTVHLDFLDLDLLAKFNQQAAEGKNWVGGGY